jgi:Holliday junction resolvasome RuvABC endonuclease subunit
VKTQIQDMVAQAEKLCAEGHAEEAADVIADASSMLSSQ